MSITGVQTQFIAPAPAHNGTATSNEAAVRIEPAAGTLRALVLDFLIAQSAHGATDEEMQTACKINANTQRPRRQELERGGWIRRTDRTRPTASGRDAVIYVAIE